MTLNNDAKFKKSWLVISNMATTQKSKNFILMGYFFLKYINFEHKDIKQRPYGLKNGMMNSVNFL